ncbi:hypothetical protein LTR85_008556 [Meristemomyces frigidus]|nr:hypothetical protein LTR85_008556 [Meristemomyces frigidus]
MSSPDPNDMHYENNESPDVPATVDRRPPQLNSVVSRCRIGCACAASRGGGEGGSDGGGLVAGICSMHSTSADDDDRSDFGGSVNGDEGAAGHKIEVGDFGLVGLKEIYTALARHQRCTCHGGVLPDETDYPFTGLNTPEGSGFLPGSSMIVELSGDERSMSSVSLPLSGYSESSQGGGFGRFSPDAFVGFMGGHFSGELSRAPTPPPTLFTAPPMWLGHERRYCFNTEVGTSNAMHYLPELSIGDSAGSTDGSGSDIR